MSNKLFTLSMALALGAALAGCSGLRNTFGVERGGPDEFNVVRHAPLTLPPDYNLRPPQPGLPRPQEPSPQAQARQVVVGSDSGLVVGSGLGSAESRSSSELALLQHAGSADPAIRDTLNQETGGPGTDRGFLDSLIFWQKPQPAGDIVDPAAEATRLEENAAQGLPVTAGETPIIKRRKRGLLEGLF